MKPVHVILENLKFDHTLWLNELYFANREISIYRDRIVNLMKGYFGETGQEELGEILEELNKLSKTTEHLTTQIEYHKNKMKKKTALNGELKSMSDTDHKRSREMMESFRVIYSHLKSSFHRFAAFQE